MTVLTNVDTVVVDKDVIGLVTVVGTDFVVFVVVFVVTTGVAGFVFVVRVPVAGTLAVAVVSAEVPVVNFDVFRILRLDENN